MRRLYARAGLLNALLDFVTGILQGFLGPGPVSLGGGESAPGDLDLDRHFLSDPVQVGTLAGQLGPSRVQLRPRQVDLVAVRGRVDLRQDLPLAHAVVLIGQESDDPAGHEFRRDIDDVGLNKRIVRNRVGAPVFKPVHHGREADGNQSNDDGQCKKTAWMEPFSTTGGRTRRGCGFGVGISARRGLCRLGCAHR